MNKLNETSSAKPRLLSDGDLMQVVGGNGHHGWGGGNRGRNQGGGNRGRNRGNGNGHGQVFFITITEVTNNFF